MTEEEIQVVVDWHSPNRYGPHLCGACALHHPCPTHKAIVQLRTERDRVESEYSALEGHCESLTEYIDRLNARFNDQRKTSESLRDKLALAEKQRDEAMEAFRNLAGEIQGSRVSYCPDKIYTAQIGCAWFSKIAARVQKIQDKGAECQTSE